MLGVPVGRWGWRWGSRGCRGWVDGWSRGWSMRCRSWSGSMRCRSRGWRCPATTATAINIEHDVHVRESERRCVRRRRYSAIRRAQIARSALRCRVRSHKEQVPGRFSVRRKEFHHQFRCPRRHHRHQWRRDHRPRLRIRHADRGRGYLGQRPGNPVGNSPSYTVAPSPAGSRWLIPPQRRPR